MESLQIRLTSQLLRRVDYLVEEGIYSNRNEAVRDAVRRMAADYDLLENTFGVRDRLKNKLVKTGKTGPELIMEARGEDDT